MTQWLQHCCLVEDERRIFMTLLLLILTASFFNKMLKFIFSIAVRSLPTWLTICRKTLSGGRNENKLKWTENAFEAINRRKDAARRSAEQINSAAINREQNLKNNFNDILHPKRARERERIISGRDGILCPRRSVLNGFPATQKRYLESLKACH